MAEKANTTPQSRSPWITARDGKRIDTFLTGKLYPAGSLTIYDAAPERALRFLRAILLKQSPNSWQVRNRYYIAGRERQECLRWTMSDLPLWCYDTVRRFDRPKLIASKDLAQLLAVYKIICLDRGFLTLQMRGDAYGTSLAMCSHGDIHVHEPCLERRRSMFRSAARVGLRCPPLDYDERTLIAPSMVDLNIKEGYVKPEDVQRTDLSLSPLAALRQKGPRE